MKVRTNIVRVAALAAVVLSVGGCTVSRKDFLNTAYGPGQSPETYRVGGPAPAVESASRVTLIRSADVSSGWAGATTAPATPAPAASQPATP
jgi:hypothetical protein